MSKFNMVLLIFMSVALILTGMFVGCAPAPEKEWDLQFAHFLTPAPWVEEQAIHHWADLVKEKTNNRVRIEVFPAGQLVPIPEMHASISSGAIDGGTTPDIYLWGLYPEMCWSYILGMAHNQNQSRIMRETKIYDWLAERTLENDVVLVSLYPATAVNIIVSREEHMKVPEDLPGKKIRGCGGIPEYCMREIGGSIISMPSAEVYPALEKGVFDVAITSASSCTLFRFPEVAPYITHLPEIWPAGFPLLMYKGLWDEFPDDIKSAITEACLEIEEWGANERLGEEEVLKQKIIELGGKWHEGDYDSWVKAFAPLAEKAYFEKAGALGQQIVAEAEKWHAEHPGE
jgi:TRAP-type C4-dicarboxylate transport system substrate-binding protein